MCCFLCIQDWISFMAISIRYILCYLNSIMHPKLKSSICKLIVSYFKSLFDLKVTVKVEQSTMLYIIVKSNTNNNFAFWIAASSYSIFIGILCFIHLVIFNLNGLYILHPCMNEELYSKDTSIDEKMSWVNWAN